MSACALAGPHWSDPASLPAIARRAGRMCRHLDKRLGAFYLHATFGSTVASPSIQRNAESECGVRQMKSARNAAR